MSDLDIRIAQTRQAMRYGPAQFKEDWDTAIALAQLMGMHGPKGRQEDQLESCFVRIRAYLAENPYEVPWEPKAEKASV